MGYFQLWYGSARRFRQATYPLRLARIPVGEKPDRPVQVQDAIEHPFQKRVGVPHEARHLVQAIFA